MKTDSWFYRFLKTWPAGFFELLGKPASEAARYHLEAVEVKKESLRIDGVFRPIDPVDPVYFLEVQGYLFPAFYANLFGKVFGYLEVNDPSQDWGAVAIFLERRFEPEEKEPYQVLLDSPKVTRVYLDELPPQADPPLALGIWEIVSASQDRVREVAPKIVRKALQELSNKAL